MHALNIMYLFVYILHLYRLFHGSSDPKSPTTEAAIRRTTLARTFCPLFMGPGPSGSRVLGFGALGFRVYGFRGLWI